jgi:alkyldihydroxyacetonephosphate synthase
LWHGYKVSARDAEADETLGSCSVQRRLKHWGWGYEDEQPAFEDLRAGAAFARERLGFGSPEPEAPVRLSELSLPPPRLSAPAALAEICFADTYERALHAYGRSYRDIVRAFRGRFDHPPDVVAYPRHEQDLEAVLEWAAAAGAAVIPFGGGTSVVGGVEPIVRERYNGAVTVDLKRLDRVLEVDPFSQAARIQAGTLGPALEQQLAAHGMTLRHFPQSFEFSTLGGWIATRAGGHFATLYTHIDELVESVRAVTPQGIWQSRRLPGSGAGISPDRMMLGSEGILGVITEAWVRIRPRPERRSSAAVRFTSFADGAAAVRAISQGGLYPANCRLIDADEARITGIPPTPGDGSHALLLLGFEAADHDVEPWMTLALHTCADHGGTWERRGQGQDSSGSWREAFLRAPYLRDLFVAVGVLSETFETAITWDRFEAFHASVLEQTRAAVRQACGGGTVTCRFTHVYPDGPAPYYTILAPARRGAELDQWAAIKRAASDAVLAAGGTITHHHAVGRDHRPWYDRQRPGPFAEALRAAKAALDPAGILNPGVLVDP